MFASETRMPLLRRSALPWIRLEAGLALSELIDQLKEYPLFRNVDILALDERRRLVPDSVLVPNGHYAISICIERERIQLAIPDRCGDGDAAGWS